MRLFYLRFFSICSKFNRLVSRFFEVKVNTVIENKVLSVTNNENSDSEHAFLNTIYTDLKKLYEANKQPNFEQRSKVLLHLKKALLTNQSELIEALNQDYGQRTAFDSLMADILPSVQHLNYTLKNLKKWMKPTKRRAGLLLSPSSIKVHMQSLGIVGVIVPWNFPIFLSLGPVITALAAGNRVMLKLSEYTPKTNQLILRIFEGLGDYVSVIQGGPQVAQQFTQLPFDHVFFTGSTQVGKLVAKTCAENLVPTTLELGGKSPVVITSSADLTKAADAIILGKVLNAGQICVAPDYVLLPDSLAEVFCNVFLERFNKLYQQQQFADEYGAIVNQKQFDRLMALLANAKAKGAKCISPNGYEINQAKRIMPPHLIDNATLDMKVCQEEIFGPILPIIRYQNLAEAIAYINDKPRPLALYVMSKTQSEIDEVLANTHSGGVCINDTLMHVGADDAPFGGIGQSGIGSYHGFEGFETFSHKRTILSTPTWLPRVRLILGHKKLAAKLLSKLFVR